MIRGMVIVTIPPSFQLLFFIFMSAILRIEIGVIFS